MQVSGFADSAAEKTKQRPAADSAGVEQKDIAAEGTDQGCREEKIKVQVSVGGDRAGGQNGHRGGDGKSDRLCKADGREQQIAVVRDEREQVVHSGKSE